MSSLSSFTSALTLFLGAILAERIGRHHKIVVVSGGIIGRITILLLVFVPMVFKGPAAIWIAIVLSVLRDGLNNMSYPSWVSVINDTVPIEGRGRYFGSRNFIMSISGMLTTLMAGKLITLFVEPVGYQFAIGLAFILGVCSFYSFARLRIPPKPRKMIHFSVSSLRSLANMMKGQSQFVALIITAAVWNFGINVTGPFFNPYMVKNLDFSASTIGALAVVTSLASLLVLNRVGSLADRFGPRKIQLASMWVIIFLPLVWLIIRHPWHVALVNIVVGAAWAAFNLCSFNFMLNFIPKDQVPRYSAFYQIVVTLSLAFGALVGSALIARWTFMVLLVVSTILRFIATFLFAIWVREPEKKNSTVQD